MALTTAAPFLSTVFTPPADCSTRPFTLQLDPFTLSGISTSILWDAQINDTKTASCTPSEWLSANPSLGQQFKQSITDVHGVCPHGYTTIGTEYGSGGWVTTAFCCPSGMSWINDYKTPYQCMTTLKANAVLIVETQVTVPFPQDSFVVVSTSVVPTPVVAFDRGMRMSWWSSDLPSFTPASAPILGLATATPSCWSVQPVAIGGQVLISTTIDCAVAASNTPKYTPAPHASSPGLPPAIIGAIVASILGSLLTLLIMGLIWWKCFFQPVRRLAAAQEAIAARMPPAEPLSGTKEEGTAPVGTQRVNSAEQT
jgi:hypothetical protein